MSKAWLSLGANIGDPPTQIIAALEHLQNHQNIHITTQSNLIQTPAWGKTDQPDFHNIAIEIATTLLPIELLDACQKIENQLGRVRKEKWGPRLIDIDIIAIDRLELKTPRLTLPHIHAHERDFVLDPLRKISTETAEWVLEISKN